MSQKRWRSIGEAAQRTTRGEREVISAKPHLHEEKMIPFKLFRKPNMF
jgi:hypothetical protein